MKKSFLSITIIFVLLLLVCGFGYFNPSAFGFGKKFPTDKLKKNQQSVTKISDPELKEKGNSVTATFSLTTSTDSTYEFKVSGTGTCKSAAQEAIQKIKDADGKLIIGLSPKTKKPYYIGQLEANGNVTPIWGTVQNKDCNNKIGSLK